MHSRLILIEGLPGSGKTVTAGFIGEHLNGVGMPAKWFLEGDPHHPTDFECEAALSGDELNSLATRFAPYRDIILSSARPWHGWYIYKYGFLSETYGERLPVELYGELASRDLAEARGLDLYLELSLHRWREFAKSVMHSDSVIILESSFLQIPVNTMRLINNAESDMVYDHIHCLEKIIRPLLPKLIYFRQKDVRPAIEAACRMKHSGWREHAVRYIARSAFGQARGLEGFDGMVAYFEERRKIEDDILAGLTLDKAMIDNTDYDWVNCRRQIVEFLKI